MSFWYTCSRRYLHRVGGEVQPFSDLPIVVAVGHFLHQLQFASGETGIPPFRAAAQSPGDLGIEVKPPLAHGSQGCHPMHSVHVRLQHNPLAVRFDGLLGQRAMVPRRKRPEPSSGRTRSSVGGPARRSKPGSPLPRTRNRGRLGQRCWFGAGVRATGLWRKFWRETISPSSGPHGSGGPSRDDAAV